MNKHPERVSAQNVVDICARRMREAENGTCEKTYLKSLACWRFAILQLCESERKHPTLEEINRRGNVIRLENRGLMG